MAKPRFFLAKKYLPKKNKADKNEAKRLNPEPTLIVMHYHIKGTRFVMSAQKTIEPRYWSDVKERAKPTSPGAKHINMALDRLAAAAPVEAEKLISQGRFTKLRLKEALHVIDGRENRHDTFMAYVRAFIKKKEASNKIKSQSIGSYVSALKKLEEFAKHKRARDFEFLDIGYEFFEEFHEWLLSQDMADSYCVKILTKTRHFLNSAKKARKDESYRDYRIERKGQHTDEIYLTESELFKLQHCEEYSPTLRRVVDLFLIGCRTGLRFSDFTKVTKKNLVEEDGYKQLEIVTQKTGQKVLIPLREDVLNILDKYDWKVKPISNQKMNEYLKEAGRMAGITGKFNRTQTRKGEPVTTRHERYELIKTHTARRTFATLAFQSSVPVSGIMSITGHKSERAFFRYIRTTPKEQAQAMAKHAFFRQETQLRVAK